ncbi:MAG: LysM domain-containing protein [Chloroflexi bacterium]|nr:LysM domain-containing protein [Chloroflexota bacterium]
MASNVVANTLSWFAGAFYVIIALAIVYLYFFRLVPLVLSSVKAWTLFDVVRITFVLGGLAVLLGCVAVFTADWIFSQVFDTLPKTRMARELSRISGSTLRVNWDTGGSESAAPSVFGSSSEPSDAATEGGSEVAAAPAIISAPVPTYPLKENALEIWAARLQNIYNPTGSVSDNIKIMNKRDIPQDVVCDVFSDTGGWWPKRYENWQLLCSNDSFKTTVPIQTNGTAARGLTGGSFYTRENPFSIYGTGRWPDDAFDTTAPLITPTPGPSGGPLSGVAVPTPGAGTGTPVAAGTPGSKHKVLGGENLAIIAKKYGITVQALINANSEKYPILAQNPNMIVAGWELTIPSH